MNMGHVLQKLSQNLPQMPLYFSFLFPDLYVTMLHDPFSVISVPHAKAAHVTCDLYDRLTTFVKILYLNVLIVFAGGGG